MMHQELEGQRGVVEEIREEGVQILLVGGIRRMKGETMKVVLGEALLPVDEMSSDFETWGFLEQLGVWVASIKEAVKANPAPHCYKPPPC